MVVVTRPACRRYSLPIWYRDWCNSPPSAAAPLSGAAAGEEDPFTLGQTFMINLARRILGIAGDGIVAKLRAAQDIDGLRALYVDWRNTIKQAPDGLLRLRELEKKLSKVLGELPTTGP